MSCEHTEDIKLGDVKGCDNLDLDIAFCIGEDCEHFIPDINDAGGSP